MYKTLDVNVKNAVKIAAGELGVIEFPGLKQAKLGGLATEFFGFVLPFHHERRR